MSSKLQFGGPIVNSPQVTAALGRLSSQAHNSMGYAGILARAVSNPGLPNHSFDGISAMTFATLLSAQIAERYKAQYSCHQRKYYVLDGISGPGADLR